MAAQKAESAAPGAAKQSKAAYKSEARKDKSSSWSMCRILFVLVVGVGLAMVKSGFVISFTPGDEDVTNFSKIYGGVKGNDQHSAYDADVARSFYNLANEFCSSHFCSRSTPRELRTDSIFVRLPRRLALLWCDGSAAQELAAPGAVKHSKAAQSSDAKKEKSSSWSMFRIIFVLIIGVGLAMVKSGFVISFTPGDEDVTNFSKLYGGVKGNDQHSAYDADVARSFYNLANEFYEYGWGDSFHFGFRRKTEPHSVSIRNSQNFIAQKLMVGDMANVLTSVAASAGRCAASCEFYEYGWGDSFHFGFRRKTEPHSVSIRNSQNFIAQKLMVGDMANVLDIGCGIGGPMRGVVRATGANVTGLTINPYQIKRGREITSELSPWMQARCHFSLQDYLKVEGLPEDHYDGAFYMESSLHCENRTQTFKEAFRLLKPGARLVAMEYLTLPGWDPKNPEHQELMRQHLHGNGAARTPSIEEDLAMVRAAGFEIVEHFDYMDLGNDIYG
eukprot:CAMPEP_0183600814 /NCGR_PEP_ID=MMETSP0371-20130417/180127_1 /TAXON_ID=268820 /ORGANISM="Peridinium aciculiferum, Strain PAER-2" /LENGTH=501 /DNA_ID=CAMNT_0025812897 /DNA_START=63 /DNA_END=1567 /DNA_ORIENTATION=-